MRNLIENLKSTFCNEDGAVTIDWVVLTASLVALGFMATAILWTQTAGVSGKIATYVDGQQISTVFADSEVIEE
ncbi:pilus assembly protein [Thioclava sp.]|uniref:pilus assembly protein n=1 Tax=Thioclava sp. TaxID=1933450 RepID=UPI003242B2B1